MSEKPQTNSEMLHVLLDGLMTVNREVAEVKSQVIEINHTIHNGMSHAIQETREQVNFMASRLDKIDVSGHPASCAYLQAVDAEQRKKKLVRNGLSTVKKAFIGFLGVIVTAGTAVTVWEAILK